MSFVETPSSPTSRSTALPPQQRRLVLGLWIGLLLVVIAVGYFAARASKASVLRSVVYVVIVVVVVAGVLGLKALVGH